MSRLTEKSGQARGVRALKRGLGEATEGKWKKKNRQIKTIKETLVYHRRHPGKVECATGK